MKKSFVARGMALFLSVSAPWTGGASLLASARAAAPIGMFVLSGCTAEAAGVNEHQDSPKLVWTPQAGIPLAVKLVKASFVAGWTISAPVAAFFVVTAVVSAGAMFVWESIVGRWQSFVREALQPPPDVRRYAALSVTAMTSFLLALDAPQSASDHYRAIHEAATLVRDDESRAAINDIAAINNQYSATVAAQVQHTYALTSFLSFKQFEDLFGRWAALSDAMTNALPQFADLPSWTSAYKNKAQQLLRDYSQGHQLSEFQRQGLVQAFTAPPNQDPAIASTLQSSPAEEDGVSFTVPIPLETGATRIATVYASPNHWGYEEAEALTESNGAGNHDDSCKQITCHVFATLWQHQEIFYRFQVSQIRVFAFSRAANAEDTEEAFCGALDELLNVRSANVNVPFDDEYALGLRTESAVQDVDPKFCKMNESVYWSQYPSGTSTEEIQSEPKPWRRPE